MRSEPPSIWRLPALQGFVFKFTSDKSHSGHVFPWMG